MYCTGLSIAQPCGKCLINFANEQTKVGMLIPFIYPFWPFPFAVPFWLFPFGRSLLAIPFWLFPFGRSHLAIPIGGSL